MASITATVQEWKWWGRVRGGRVGGKVSTYSYGDAYLKISEFCWHTLEAKSS